MPPGFGNDSGCSAHAMACSPPSRLVAGVFRSSSLMQNTRAARTAGSSRPAALLDDLFQRHTIACAAPCGQNHIRLGRRDFFCGDGLAGRPTNSPPADSTSSATQGCEAMIGFPHSSQNTLNLGVFAIRSRTVSDRTLHSRRSRLARDPTLP